MREIFCPWEIPEVKDGSALPYELIDWKDMQYHLQMVAGIIGKHSETVDSLGAFEKLMRLTGYMCRDDSVGR